MTAAPPSGSLLVLGTQRGRGRRGTCAMLAARAGAAAATGWSWPDRPAPRRRSGSPRRGARFAAVPIADRPHPANDARSVARLRALRRGADAVHAHGLRAGALAALALTGTRTGPAPGHPAQRGHRRGRDRRDLPGLERIVARRADHVLVGLPRSRGAHAGRAAATASSAAVGARPPAPAAGRARTGTAGRCREDPGRTAGPPAEGPAGAAHRGQARPAERAWRPCSTPRPGRPPADRVVRGSRGRGRCGTRCGPGSTADGPARAFCTAGPTRPICSRWRRAVLVPSRWEGQPLDVQEALRAGTPIIATGWAASRTWWGTRRCWCRPGDAGRAARGDRNGCWTTPRSPPGSPRPRPPRGASPTGRGEALKAVLAVYRAQCGRSAHPGTRYHGPPAERTGTNRIRSAALPGRRDRCAIGPRILGTVGGEYPFATALVITVSSPRGPRGLSVRAARGRERPPAVVLCTRAGGSLIVTVPVWTWVAVIGGSSGGRRLRPVDRRPR